MREQQLTNEYLSRTWVRFEDAARVECMI